MTATSPVVFQRLVTLMMAGTTVFSAPMPILQVPDKEMTTLVSMYQAALVMDMRDIVLGWIGSSLTTYRMVIGGYFPSIRANGLSDPAVFAERRLVVGSDVLSAHALLLEMAPEDRPMDPDDLMWWLYSFVLANRLPGDIDIAHITVGPDLPATIGEVLNNAGLRYHTVP